MQTLNPDWDNTPFYNRFKKRWGHLKKWAKREGVSCFRVYERDLPEYPITCDFLDGDVVVWIHPGKQDDDPIRKESFFLEVTGIISFFTEVGSSRIFVKYRGRQTGKTYQKVAKQKIQKVVRENGVSLELNLSDYLDVGLFLDHRITRKMVGTESNNKRVLNLFAYTGSFTCYAGLAGASETVSVDLNPNYSDWIKRNISLNGLNPNNHHVISEDCRIYLKAAKKQKQKFDLIICDPPTFSNAKRSKEGIFSVDEDHVSLIQSCLDILNPNGVLYFSTNSKRFKLDPALFSSYSVTDITLKTTPEDFRGKNAHYCYRFQII